MEEKRDSFAVNRATRALKLFPSVGIQDPQAAAAGGYHRDGWLGKKEPGFGNQSSRIVVSGVVFGPVEFRRWTGPARISSALYPRRNRAGSRRVEPGVPLRGVRARGYSPLRHPSRQRGRGARGASFRSPAPRSFSRQPAQEVRGPAGKTEDQGGDLPSKRSASADIGTGPMPVPFLSCTNIRTRICACAYAWLQITFYVFCAFTHHIWVDTAQDAGASFRWMTMEGWHGKERSAGNQAGTAG